MSAEPASTDAQSAVSLDDFDGLYETFYQPVYRAVRAIVLDAALAEDVTQDAFFKAYRNRSRYQPYGSLGAWIHRIAVRQAISAIRWRDLHHRLLHAVKLKSDQPVVDNSLGDLLRQLLQEVNPGTRAALILHYYHGYRYREVAAIMGIPEGTVATRIANGLRRMKRILDAE